MQPPRKPPPRRNRIPGKRSGPPPPPRAAGGGVIPTDVRARFRREAAPGGPDVGAIVKGIGGLAVAAFVIGGAIWGVLKSKEGDKAIKFNDTMVTLMEQASTVEDDFFTNCLTGNRGLAEALANTFRTRLDEIEEKVGTTECPESGAFFKTAIKKYIQSRRSSFDARADQLLELAGGESADREERAQEIVDELVAADAAPLAKLVAEQKKFADKFGFDLK